MSKDLLDLHLKLLVLEHGRTRVLQSLAHINEVSESSIISQLEAAAQIKVSKSLKSIPTPEQLLAKMELTPSKRERMATLAREFVNKRFLGELRLVAKFFRDNQAGTPPKTRMKALPKVLTILAKFTERDLDDLIADCSNESVHSGYSNLAGAIMGQR